jgi:dipeptidyl aminopeptidase/acylaminoacyl peptidase
MEPAPANSGEHDTVELTAELIADSVMPWDPVISPDGRWVAYVVAPIGAQKDKRRADLWVAAIDASTAPRRFTHGGARVARPRWAADSAAVFFLRDDQLHRIRLDGGEATALTSWGASPLSYASRVRTPVLIVHGEKDSNVPVGQAVNFHRAISQFSAGHELVIYPREGHGFTERDHQIDVMRRSRAWFDRWLPG